MEENINESVAAPEINNQEDVALEEVNQQEPAEAKQFDNSPAANLVKLREAKERAEKEKAELEAQLKSYKQQQEGAAPQEDGIPYEDNDFVEGRVLKHEITTLKKQLEAFQKQQIQTTDEEKLRRQYSDFDEIVNPDNMKLFKEKDPEMADIIARSQSSLYSRGAAAYKRIKELTYSVKDNHAQDREKAHSNMSKPRPMNSVSPQSGDSPLSMANAFANGLTPELKKQLWKEMEEAAKRH